ncbi:hypothetical protein FF38_12894 [Lucilia cuprina]|uniref:F-box domain-containing protein n=1 Tax=Lucilia cuprina TaxID=7375 RepID=A0A0L0C0C6_LUCCU|nr:hypothetical protein FF38_12894 [Lucilia cuprina]
MQKWCLMRGEVHYAKDYPSQLLTPRRSAKTLTTHLQDLNHDCLREIFQHLDLAAQFSLLKSSQQFYDIILYDIWYPYYDEIFDLSKDLSIATQTKDFQMDFLSLILNNFSRVQGIVLEIFQKYMNKFNNKEFPQVLTLKILNTKNSITENNILDLQHIYKFPYLQELQLEDICIEFSLKECLIPLKVLTLRNVTVLNANEGDLLKIILSSNLEKLTLLTLPSEHFAFTNFSEISKCLQLKELTLSLHYLHEPRLLDYILDLPSLQILTLESKDNFYFSSKDHTILYVILKIFSQNPYKSIRGLQLNGMPEKIFYMCPYLQDIKTLNWFVTKIFHRKLDGSVEWKSDVPQVIKSFYDFVVDNGSLKNLYVKDNIFHKKRVIKDANFENKLQELRESKGFQRLNIISNYKKSDVSKVFYDLPEGGVRFFIESRE